MFLITRNGLIVAFPKQRDTVLLLCLIYIYIRGSILVDTILGDAIGVTNNHICRLFSRSISRYDISEVIIRMEVFKIFFYKNLFTSMRSYILSRKKKDKTRGNDRFNFDAKRIKVLPPVMNFLRQLSEKFRCTVSNAVVTPGGRKLLRLKIFIGR